MKNDFEIRGEVTAIFLKKRTGEIFETIIDTHNLDKVSKLNLSWHLMWVEPLQNYYAKATEYLGIIDGKPKYRTVYLQSVITSTIGLKVHVDHLSHNTLDNRDINLKVKTVRGNALNRSGANRNTTTGYRNVSYDKTNNKYIVQLQLNGKNKVLGKFNDVDEAGKFAEEMRIKYYKDK